MASPEERLTMDYPVTVVERPKSGRIVKGNRVKVPRAEVNKMHSDVGAVQAAAGMDTHPGGEQLKHYWVYGEGAAKWSTWTELYHHLLKYLNPEMAKRTAAEWFHERYQIWPGADLNRVKHGKPPRGHVVGPG